MYPITLGILIFRLCSSHFLVLNWPLCSFTVNKMPKTTYIQHENKYRIIIIGNHYFHLTQNLKSLLINLRGFSPQANYTNRATAACRRSYCQLLWTKGVTWSAQRIPMAVNFGFLDPEPLHFHSSSSSFILTRETGPRSSPITSQKIW
jgi:hypothetical protein